MNHKEYYSHIGAVFALTGFTVVTLMALISIPFTRYEEEGSVKAASTIAQSTNTQQQKDLYGPTTEPTPTPTPGSVQPPTPTARPQAGGKSYCIDDEGAVPGNEPCDDASRFDIAKGAGGVTGSCGTVIDWDQQIMDALQKGTGNKWDDMPTSFTNCNYSSTPTNQYVSSLNVIDAYNLAGFHELTAVDHTVVTDMISWWQGSQAQTAGYTYIPVTGTSIQTILPQIKPGMTMFLGSHAGIVNSIEVDANGNGWISILHSNTSYWLGVVIVANWQIRNTPSNYPLTGFGSH